MPKRITLKPLSLVQEQAEVVSLELEDWNVLVRFRLYEVDLMG